MDTMRRIMLLACCLAACICVMDTEVTARVGAGASTASTTATTASGQSGGGMLDEGLSGRVWAAPAGAQVVRTYASGKPPTRDALLGDNEKLIYSNNGDPFETLFYSPPLAGARIADDLFTNAVGDCPITKFSIRVNGGIPNGMFVRFNTIVALTTYCPSTNYWGQTIPGTEITFRNRIADINTIHELVVDYADPNIGICANDAGCRINQQDCYDGSQCVPRGGPVRIPSQVWLRVEFSRREAGWVVGAPPIVGFSPDQYDNYFTGCNSWFGGYPNFIHASFYAQFWAPAAEGVCPTHFLAYLAFDAERDAYGAYPTGTKDQLLADDIELIDGVVRCELSAIEVGTKGTHGPYEIQFDLRNSPSGNPFVGTEQRWRSSNRAGNGNLELARLTFPDDLWVDQHFWITWEANKADTGVINPQRNQAGGHTTEGGLSVNRFFGWYGPPWAEEGEWDRQRVTSDGKDAVFYFAVYCKGEIPTGPCCARQPDLPDMDPACLDDVPVTSCFGGRWLRSTEQNPKLCPSSFYDGECEDGTYCGTLGGCPDETCETPPCECEALEDPWAARGQPACGTHACCRPDNECENLPRDECVAITHPDSGNPAVWNRGDFCGTNNQRCPFFACYYSSVACTDCNDPFIECYYDDAFCREQTGWPDSYCKMPDRVCTIPAGCTNVYCCDWVCNRPGNTICCNVGWDCTCKALAQDCPGPPSNDDCSDDQPGFGAIEIDLTECQGDRWCGHASSGHDAATKGPLEPGMCCHNGGVNKQAVGTVWYKFRPAQNGSVRLHTCGTAGGSDAKDSIIQVFSAPFADIGLCQDGSECTVGELCADDACDEPPCECSLDEQRLCDSLLVEGCNEDAPTSCGSPIRPGLADLCIPEVTAGELYYIMVGAGSPDQQGNYRLDIIQPCESRDVPPPESACEGAEIISPGVDPSYDLEDATLDCPGEECLVGMKNDVWFLVQPECTGYMLVRTCDMDVQTSEENTTLAVYEGLDCPPGEDDLLGCNDDAVSNYRNHNLHGMPQWCAGTDGECEDGTSCTTLESCPDWTCAAGVDCECVSVMAACDEDSDCPRTCTIGGNACTEDEDCDLGICEDGTDCSVSGETCVDELPCRRLESCDPAVCISACWPGAMVEVLVSEAEWYHVRVGGSFGSQPSGDMRITCIEEDCNRDFVPDPINIQNCDPKELWCRDCNQNNVPDNCDMAFDPDNWKDCDDNLIPDRCQIRQVCFGPERPYFCNPAVNSCAPDLNNNCILDECEPTCPIGDIVWEEANPPTGVIDARQPHPLNGTTAQGIFTIVVDGPTGMNLGEECFTLCETRVDGSENSVTTVTEDPTGTYTIRLDRPISVGAVTKISYHPEGVDGGWPRDTAVFTSLPADPSASALPEIVDIAELVSCCLNGTCLPAFGGYSCDTNDSGTVTGEDILRLIDLLHGAEGFGAWKNVPPYDEGECD